MTFRILISVFAVAQVIGGIACIASPAMMLQSFRVDFPPMGLVIYQFWGASMATIGVQCWLVRNTSDPRSSMSFCVALIALNAVNCVLALKGQASGANAMGWAMVALYAIFALAFLIVAIRLMRKEVQQQ